MTGDVKVQDAPTIVADHEKAVEKAESNRWYGEEIHRRNGFPMVAKEKRANVLSLEGPGALVSSNERPFARRDQGRA